jgi:hypothetical protein
MFKKKALRRTSFQKYTRGDILNLKGKVQAMKNGCFFISSEEAAKQLGIHVVRMREIILEGRIKGVYKIGGNWAVPSDFVFRKKFRWRPIESLEQNWDGYVKLKRHKEP